MGVKCRSITTFECDECGKTFKETDKHWHIPVDQVIELQSKGCKETGQLGLPVSMLQVGHGGSDPDVYEPDRRFCGKKCLMKCLKEKVDMVEDRWGDD